MEHIGAKFGKISDTYLWANAAYSDKSRFERKPSYDRDRGRSGSRRNWKGKYDNRYHDKNKPIEGKRYDDGKKKEDDKNKGVYCFKCLQLGHIKTNCTLSENDAKECKEFLKNAPWVRSQKSDQHLSSSFAHPELVLKSGDTCTAGQSAIKPWETKHVYSGLLKQKGKFQPASILRDTGSAVHAIHEQFVEPSQYLSNTQKLITFGGACETFRLAEIDVDTPFIVGKIKACVISGISDTNRCFDILIGNGGVLDSPAARDPHPDVISSWSSCHEPLFSNNQVDGRNDAVKESSQCLFSVDSGLSCDKVVSVVKEDVSLTECEFLLREQTEVTDNSNVSFELLSFIITLTFLFFCFDDSLPYESADGFILEEASGSLVEEDGLDTPTPVQAEPITNLIVNDNREKTSERRDDETLVDSTNVPCHTDVVTSELHSKDETCVFEKQNSLSLKSKQLLYDKVDDSLPIDKCEQDDSDMLYCSSNDFLSKNDVKTHAYRDITLTSLNFSVTDKCFLSIKLLYYCIRLLFLCGLCWNISFPEKCRPLTAFQAAGDLCFGFENTSGIFDNKMMFYPQVQREDVVFSFDNYTVFHKIFDVNLRVKPKKAEFCFGEIQFLGHVVGNGRLKPADDNTNKIINIEVPKTKRHVKSVMGLVTYYSKFLPHLSTLMKPITRLVEKASPKQVIWTDECQRALSAVKSAISAQPSLKLPNLNHPFCVQTDASGTGLGGVLLQHDGDYWRPCAFVSRKLTPCEQRYAVIERECLAIYWTVHRLARYLLGRQFVLQTDHRPLQFLLDGRPGNCRLFRWALSLQQFDFTIEYIRGQDNILADFLSRY